MTVNENKSLLHSLFGGLRGKLTLTYTLVTVLALLALEVLVIALILLSNSVARVEEREYLDDVLYTMYPRAREYLQPGREDLPGLQSWLEGVAEEGYASLQPMGLFDSPAAKIVPGSTLLVLSPDLTVLAQAPQSDDSLVGRRYTPTADNEPGSILDNALGGRFNSLTLARKTADGNYLVAVPVAENDTTSPVVGVILVEVRPSPPMLLSTWPVYVAAVLGTGFMLLVAVAPFGALFGLIMSRGLISRLKNLSRAADAWSVGNFQVQPADRSKDEVGALSLRLRNMAEKLQSLLETQQQLAAIEERNRLARELHDTIKQQNFATLMQVRAARNLLNHDPEEAGAYLSQAETLLKTSQQELGTLIKELRPAALEGQGLSEALLAYLHSWTERTRIPAELHVSDEQSLPLAVEHSLYRVAQEALSNVARHSRASAVSVDLDFLDGDARLEVKDNGVGFHPQQVAGQGYGLDSMRERIAALGGRLEVESVSGEGTRLIARVPMKGEEGGGGS